MADAKACTGLQIGLDCTMVYQAGVDPTTTTLDSHSFSPCQMSFYDTGFLHRSHSLSISLHTVQPLWLQRHYTPTHARRQASIRIQTSPPPRVHRCQHGTAQVAAAKNICSFRLQHTHGCTCP